MHISSSIVLNIFLVGSKLSHDQSNTLDLKSSNSEECNDSKYGCYNHYLVVSRLSGLNSNVF